MPPTREERRKCYQARDLYFKCLDNGMEGGTTGTRGSTISDTTTTKTLNCLSQLDQFHKNCLKSWVEHFENEREKEIQRQKTVSRLESQKQDGNYLEKLINK